ncbi:cytochrome P460 family protein [Paraburkholderia sp. SIMBA_049]
MYDPVEMMEVLAMCIALAGVVYLPQLLSSARSTAPLKPVLEYSVFGDLIFPSDFYDWIHVRLGDELDPNLLDSNVLTTFHDLYIAPEAHRYFISTRIIPDGTIAFKRFDKQIPIKSSGLADQSCRRCSVASEFKYANVAVKDRLHFGENNQWAFFRLNQADFDNLQGEI